MAAGQAYLDLRRLELGSCTNSMRWHLHWRMVSSSTSDLVEPVAKAPPRRVPTTYSG